MKPTAMKVIDLRSDTVTHPTPAMRKAMFKAEVGDDVYGDDPTVNRLEAMAAEMTGKEAALFTTSGTQSNLIAVLTHTHHGDEIIVGDEAHMLWYGVGGAAALGGVTMRTVPNDSYGRLNLDDIDRAIRTKDIHYPETPLICLENTHNRCGGTILSTDYTDEVCSLAHNMRAKGASGWRSYFQRLSCSRRTGVRTGPEFRFGSTMPFERTESTRRIAALREQGFR
jgi:threonine aldolase